MNDTGDPATNAPAYDFVGGLNGAYGTAAQNGFNGIPGPQPPDFPGFDSGNLAAGFNATPQCSIPLPPLNLNTNTLTIVAWVYPEGLSGSERCGLLHARRIDHRGCLHSMRQCSTPGL